MATDTGGQIKVEVGPNGIAESGRGGIADYAGSGDRQGDIHAAADALVSAVTVWQEDNDLLEISDAVVEAVEDYLNVLESGDIPGDCRPYLTAAYTIRQEWDAWQATVRTSGNRKALPGGGFWKATEAVRAARFNEDQPPDRRLETARELRRQGVNLRQIAEMYGFRTRDGRPDIQAAEEEADQPGRHTGPGSGWVNPLVRRDREKRAAQVESARRARAKLKEKIAVATKPPPETLGELVANGVSANQIATMLGITVAAVYERCRAEGLEPPAEHYEPLQNARAPQEPALLEEVKRAMDYQHGKERTREYLDPATGRAVSAAEVAVDNDSADEVIEDDAIDTITKSPEERIKALHRQGLDPEGIQAVLRAANIKVKLGKIREVVASL